jgi:mitotic spindle assembly checkpoint protein MAD2B
MLVRVVVVVAAIFERRRHFNVPVQWARHPDLREYIHSAVASLQPWIQQVRLLSLVLDLVLEVVLIERWARFQGAVEKIAVLFVDGNQVPVEKVMFKLRLKQMPGAAAGHIEFALRGFLLKLCVSPPLPPLPPGRAY